MEHTRIHTENTYECDECNWRFHFDFRVDHPRTWVSMTPENTPATGAQDTFKHPNYCCNTEIENITLSVLCVMDAFPSEDQLTSPPGSEAWKAYHRGGWTKRNSWRKPKKEETRKRTQRRKWEEATRTPATFSCGPVCELLLQPKRTRRPHPQVPHLHLWRLPTHLQDSTRTGLPQRHHARHYTQKTASKASPKMRRWYANGDTKQWWKTSKKNWDRWRDVKDMAARERWAEYWAAWAAQKSLGRRQGKRKEEEKIWHKRGSWSSSRRRQGQRSGLCEIGRRQQYGSTLCTFQKGAQESRRGRETNKLNNR